MEFLLITLEETVITVTMPILPKAIDKMGYPYMLDIHSDQKIFTQKPDLFLPERKGSKGPDPKKLKATTPDMNVSEYMD